MNKQFLAAATLSAWAGMTTCAAAQSSVTLYGLLDMAVDRTHKSEGDVSGTVYGISNGKPVPNAIASPATTTLQVAPSFKSQSYIGIKGSEDLGGGYQAGFTLESGISPDTGTTINDGRLFGRQAYVGLTTPMGELRLGRQASPMLIAYYLSTVDEIGSADIMAGGIVVNNLQQFQDNVASYLVKTGPWLGALSYSPNAGVANIVSAARSTAGSVPAATAGSGQILGGLTAGAESADHRGNTQGAMLSYSANGLTLTTALHRNRFGVPIGQATANGGVIPLFNAERYRAAMAAIRYTIADTGTTLAANVHSGQFDLQGNLEPRVRTWALGVRQPLKAFSASLEYINTQFTNFTRGKDTGLMAGLDYHFSQRTALYSRAGYVKDQRGSLVPVTLAPVSLAGGPLVLLLPVGALEVPLFSGAGANMNARTSLISFGIRHTF